MSLTVTKAAELMQVTEKTVLNWIRKEKLPATKVNDEYCLNKVELLEWATNHGIKLSPEIFAVEEQEEELPALSAALQTGGIHYGVKGTDQQTVLKNVVEVLPLPPQVDREFMFQVLMAREALGTTAIGDGIAIPHVRNPILLNLTSPAITLCFLEQPIDFKSVDDKPVNILFTLVSPTVKTHLHILAKLAYGLRDSRFKEVLHRSGTEAEIMKVVRTIESEIDKS